MDARAKIDTAGPPIALSVAYNEAGTFFSVGFTDGYRGVSSLAAKAGGVKLTARSVLDKRLPGPQQNADEPWHRHRTDVENHPHDGTSWCKLRLPFTHASSASHCLLGRAETHRSTQQTPTLQRREKGHRQGNFLSEARLRSAAQQGGHTARTPR